MPAALWFNPAAVLIRKFSNIAHNYEWKIIQHVHSFAPYFLIFARVKQIWSTERILDKNYDIEYVLDHDEVSRTRMIVPIY